MLFRSRENVREVLSKDLSNCKLELPKVFKLEIRYRQHKDAYKRTFYPGVTKVDEHTISYTSNDYMEVLSLMNYLI